MEKTYLKLRVSEQAVVASASRIYAAYVMANRVTDETTEDWIKRSVEEATRIAKLAEESITSDNEMS